MINFLFILILLILTFFLVRGDLATLTINLNASSVWWNDSIEVRGKVLNSSNLPEANVNITVRLEGSFCNTTTNFEGEYLCVVKAPLELGKFDLIVEAKKDNFFIRNSTQIEVKIVFGKEVIGIKDRAVLELPTIIQEPSGKIKIAIARIIIWRG